MNDDQSQLQAIRTQTLQLLQQVRSEPKPTYWIDGQRVHWEQYAESLQRTVDWCDQKLADEQPFEIRSQGVS